MTGVDAYRTMNKLEQIKKCYHQGVSQFENWENTVKAIYSDLSEINDNNNQHMDFLLALTNYSASSIKETLETFTRALYVTNELLEEYRVVFESIEKSVDNERM